MRLNKEFLEQKGWKYKYHFNTILKFEKGNVWNDNGMGAFLEYDISNNNIKIITTDNGYNQDGPNYSVKFNGLCENTENFDSICKLINIKI